jgi:hypothetical protein
MAAHRTAIEILESIDASLKLLVTQQRAAQPKAVASDRDLDGQYGDPVLKFMPRDWTGPSFKGRHFSECPPDLLDLVSDTFEFFGKQADAKGEHTDKGKPTGDYKRADAARARGWAKRIRSGTHQQRGEPVGVSVTARWAEEGDSGFS